MIFNIEGVGVCEIGQRIFGVDVLAVWTCPGGDGQVGWFTFSVHFWCFAPRDDGGRCYWVKEHGGEQENSAKSREAEEHLELAIWRFKFGSRYLVRVLVKIDGLQGNGLYCLSLQDSC